jgi:hypothetical protein
MEDDSMLLARERLFLIFETDISRIQQVENEGREKTLLCGRGEFLYICRELP